MPLLEWPWRKKTSPTLTTVALDRIINAGNYAGASSVTIDENSAASLSTFYSCAKILAETVAQTPCNYYKIKAGFATPDADDSLDYMLSVAPNDQQTAYNFFENLIVNQIFCGVAYTRPILSSVDNQVIGFLPVNPRRVTVKRDAVTGYIAHYEIRDHTGRATQVPVDDLIRHEAFGGMSMLQAAKSVMGTLISAERHQAATLRNGARLRGLLKVTGRYRDEESIKRGREFDEAYSGDNAERTAIIGADEDYKPVTMSNNDIQLLNSREFDRANLCGMMRVPTYMVTGESQAGNMEFELRRFYLQGVGPFYYKIAQDFRRWIILRGVKKAAKFTIKFAYEDYLKGDGKTQAYVYDTCIKNGTLSPDEVRRLMNYPPRPDGTGGDFVQITELNTGNISGPVPTETGVTPENRGTLNGNQ